MLVAVGQNWPHAPVPPLGVGGAVLYLPLGLVTGKEGAPLFTYRGAALRLSRPPVLLAAGGSPVGAAPLPPLLRCSAFGSALRLASLFVLASPPTCQL